PPRSLRFPYTTLFRSEGRAVLDQALGEVCAVDLVVVVVDRLDHLLAQLAGGIAQPPLHQRAAGHRRQVVDEAGPVLLPRAADERSEEHTSELQSRENL